MDEKKSMALIEGIQKEIARCREILSLCGNSPQFFIGKDMILLDISNAEKAMAENDDEGMLKNYKKLKCVIK